jgi:endonuclease NucS-like protein
MADVDAFGLRLGSKVSKAASLAARPQGATMAEIVEATGDGVTKHNILRQLKGDGHPLRCEGKGKEKRFFLKHKDGIVINDVPDVKEWPLLPEQKLQQTVRRNLDKLEPGLVAIDGGREQGRRDITAKDQAGNIVVIELWAGNAGKDKVVQLLVYMGEVKAAQNPSGLRGILVAGDFQATVKAAASVVPTIALKRYNFLGRDHLTFETA